MHPYAVSRMHSALEHLGIQTELIFWTGELVRNGGRMSKTAHVAQRLVDDGENGQGLSGNLSKSRLSIFLISAPPSLIWPFLRSQCWLPPTADTLVGE